jgi:GMP synthase (glutamine-hydrolysing)
MILLVDVCKEPLHYLEFVKPVEDILKEVRVKCFVRNYKQITKTDINNANKIIICGTSLKDNGFLKNIKNFSWVKSTDKPILGICAGMQVICLIFGGKVNKETEIGFYFENFNKKFLGLSGKREVYHLHNNFVSLPQNFENFTNSKILQSIKHKEKEIYGVLFHPEVRNKELIRKFINKD